MDPIWLGSREFIITTVLDKATTPATVLTSYDVALLPLGTPIDAATWVPVTTYSGDRGAWADNLPVDVYRVFARVGSGSPNERNIVYLDIFSVRSR